MYWPTHLKSYNKYNRPILDLIGLFHDKQVKYDVCYSKFLMKNNNIFNYA